MSVLRPRTRLVIFRLSEDEYKDLKAAYPLRGARSISDFARSAVMRSVGAEDGTEESVQRRLSSLGSKISELESRVRSLLQFLETRAKP